jgi:hypothetical protein
MGLLDWLTSNKRSASKHAAASPSEIAAFFNEASKDEEHFPSTIDPRILHVRAVIDHLGDLSGKSVVDAGSGKGRFATLVKQANPTATIVAIDIATAMLRHVPEGVARAAGSLTALPIATGPATASTRQSHSNTPWISISLSRKCAGSWRQAGVWRSLTKTRITGAGSRPRPGKSGSASGNWNRSSSAIAQK